MGAVFALGIAALMIRFDCLTVMGGVCLLLGLICIAGSLAVANAIASTLLGVVAFSSLWSILELFKQKERVEKGWFPANPKRQKRQ